MSQEKYIGMDVHQATISVAVMDGNGKLLMECLLETKAATILEFVQGLRGTLFTDFRRRNLSCLVTRSPEAPRQPAGGLRPAKGGSVEGRSDRIDARKLAELLRTNQLKAVYHGEHGIRTNAGGQNV
jgi:hypothetical protein